MKNSTRRILDLLRPIMLIFLGLFFDRDHLCGRHFDHHLRGYLWCFRSLWARNVLRLAPTRPWPVALSSQVANPKNLHFHPDDLNNLQSPGCYFQNHSAQIRIGKGSYIGPNVGIITANHSSHQLDGHDAAADVVIGPRCWLGMNCVILPGVVLGAETIVGAGAIVTRSFRQGGVVIGGAPARVIKTLVSNGNSAADNGS